MMDEKMNKLRKAIRNARRVNSGLLVVLIALVLIVPISIATGHWFDALCHCLWIYIGVQWYRQSEDIIETQAAATELIAAQDHLIDKLAALLHETEKKEKEEEKEIEL